MLIALIASSAGAEEPSALQIDPHQPQISLFQIARLAKADLGLFLVRDSERREFSIAECTGSNPSDKATPSRCQLVTDKWLPSDRWAESAFDETFTQILIDEDAKLQEQLGSRNRLKNLAIASMTGASVAASMSTFRLGSRGTMVDYRILAAVVITDLLVFAGMEFYDGQKRETQSLESELLKRGLRGREVGEFSNMIYDIIKKSAVRTLALPQET